MSKSKEPNWLFDAAVLIAHEISLAEHGGAQGIRDEGLLASALARPKQLAAYGTPTLHELAAVYCAGIVRNHPFMDGNKRTGFLAGAAFLELNGFELTASEAEATRMIMALAAGQAEYTELAAWFKANSKPRQPSPAS